MTPAERQAKRRAIQRGEYHYCQEVPNLLPPGYTNPNLALPAPEHRAVTFLPPPSEGSSARALPAPAGPPAAAAGAIQKVGSSSKSNTSLAKASHASELALCDADGPDAALDLSLPPAVAGRLRSLLERQRAGKSITAQERAEAQGLLDIAEYFIVQRLRRRLAA